jgi:hypothetical protein
VQAVWQDPRAQQELREPRVILATKATKEILEFLMSLATLEPKATLGHKE